MSKTPENPAEDDDRQEVKRKNLERRQMMLEGRLVKVIPAIALPMVITMLIDSLYNMADAYFVSQLGDAAIAAVSVNDSLMNLIRSLAMIFGMGSASYLSRSLGAGRDEDASRATITTLLSAMAVIGVVAIASIATISPLCDLLGASATMKPYTMEYALWTLIFSPCTVATVCLSQSLRAEGATNFSMWGSASGCVINCFLDPLFISYFGWGVAGAAIATGISKLISVIILLRPYLRKKTVISLKLRLFTPKPQLYGEIFKMGVPVGLRSSMMSIAAIIINREAMFFGDAVTAAVGIANKSTRLVGSAVMGFGQGFQPIAGYSWGAGKYKRVMEAFKLTTIIGLSIGAVLGALLSVFARQSVEIFSSQPETIKWGVILVVSQSVVLPFHVFVMIASGLFQAIGKPLQSALLGLSRQAFALIPAVIIMTRLFGLQGLTLAQACADVLAFLISLVLLMPMISRIKRMEDVTEAPYDPNLDLLEEAFDQFEGE